MIFKTITSSVDESRKTLALFNKDWNTYKTNWQKGFSQSGFTGGVKSLFQSSNSSSVISNEQVQILRNWNNAVKHGCTNQATFNRIIANADENTKMYFAGLNKGKASMEGLKNAQNVAKTSTIGLTIAQTALNMAISMGLMAAISLAIKGFDKLVNSAKRASEAADEAFSETNDKVQEYDNELKSLDELITKYKELKESGNLDLEGRKEIKEVQNDIADLVGTQAKNLDLVNGKLGDEIKKLDEISAKEAKRAYETATANYNNSQKANEEAVGDDSFLFVDGYAYTGKREKEAEKILKEAGFGGNVQSGGFFGNTLFVMDSFDNNMKELKGAQEKADYLQSMIDVLEQNGQRATDLYAGLIQQRDDYLTYLDNQRSAANSLVNSWLAYSQFSNEELSKINVDSVESFETYRQKMIDEAKKDESIGKALADCTLSEEDLENSVNDFMATATQFSIWYEQWIGNVQSSTLNENPISSLSITETIDQLNTKLKPAFDSLKSAYQDIFTTDDNGNELFTLENVDLSSMLDKIKSALDDLNKNEELGISIDYSSFETLANILANSESTADDVRNAMNGLAGTVVQSLNPSLQSTTVETYQLTQSMLKSLGVANAEEVMLSALGYSLAELSALRKSASDAGFDLTNATDSEINMFIWEQTETGNCAQELYALQLKKVLLNSTTINTSADIEYILGLANSAGIASNALVKLAEAKQMLDTANANGDVRGIYEAKKYANQLRNEIQNDVINFKVPEISFDGTDKNKSKSNKSGGSSSSSSEKDLWLEEYKKKLEELKRQLNEGRLMPSSTVMWNK